MRDMLCEVVARLREQAAEAGSAISIGVDEASGPIVARWDRGRIEQVVTNLLSNAIKYGSGREISLTARAEGERVFIAVRDGGHRDRQGRSGADLSRLRAGRQRPPGGGPGPRALHRPADRHRARRRIARHQRAGAGLDVRARAAADGDPTRSRRRARQLIVTGRCRCSLRCTSRPASTRCRGCCRTGWRGSRPGRSRAGPG